MKPIYTFVLFVSLSLVLFGCDTGALSDAQAPETPSAIASGHDGIFEYHIATENFICNFESFPGEFCPAVTGAANGDVLEITNGEGRFNVHTKRAWGGGEFVHKTASGDVVGSGTWRAYRLDTFIDEGSSPVLPEILHAGRARLFVRVKSGDVVFDALLKITCVLPEIELPPTWVEGYQMNVRRAINFNNQVGGGTVFCPGDCGDFDDLFD